MYRFMSILKRDTLNLFLNPMWVILCIAFPFFVHYYFRHSYRGALWNKRVQLFIPIAKIIATFLFTGVFFSFSGGLTHLFFDVNFGGRMLIFVWLLILALDLFFSCLGVLICCIFKSEGTANQVLSLITAFLGLLSGLFFPVASLGKTMVSISNFSPVTKVLDTVFVMIYDQNYSQFLPVLLILLLLSLVTMVLIGFLFNGEDYV